MKISTNLLLASVLMLGLSACTSSSDISLGGKCSTTGQCKTGLFCTAGLCEAASTACKTAVDCASGQLCTNGNCTNPTLGGVPTIQGVAVDANGNLTIQGTNLTGATGVTVTSTSPAVSATMSVSSVTATQVTAAATAALNFISGVTYNFVVSTASASASFTISFSPGPASVTPAMLAQTGCQPGQTVLFGATGFTCGSAGSLQTRSQTLSIFTALLGGGSPPGLDFSQGITFPTTGTDSSASFNFSLPSDFASSGALVLLVSSSQEGGTCTDALQFTSGFASRANAVPDNGYLSSSAAVSATPFSGGNGISTVSLPLGNAAYGSVQAGDSISLTVTRPTSGTPCDAFAILGASLSYTPAY